MVLPAPAATLHWVNTSAVTLVGLEWVEQRTSVDGGVENESEVAEVQHKSEGCSVVMEMVRAAGGELGVSAHVEGRKIGRENFGERVYWV